MPPSFAVHLAVPILRDFRRAVSEVEIDLVSPYGVGPPLERRRRGGRLFQADGHRHGADLLWPVRVSLLCVPEIAAKHSPARASRRFIEANELLHVRIADLPRHHLWSQFARQANLHAVNVERGLVFDTAHARRAIRAERRGLALVDTNLFSEEIRTGRLVRPFDNEPRRRLRLLLDHAPGRIGRHRDRACFARG
jgi:DNA-binding transcriptional LysR family regulator